MIRAKPLLLLVQVMGSRLSGELWASILTTGMGHRDEVVCFHTRNQCKPPSTGPN